MNIKFQQIEVKKALFFSTLPPPYHGASMSSMMCLDILKSDSRFEVKNVRMNYSLEMADAGKLSLKKVFGVIKVIQQIFSSLKFNPDIIYFVPAVTGPALFRDFLFLKLIKILSKRNIVIHLRGQFKMEDWKNPFTKYIIKDLLVCNKLIVLGPELIENLNHAVAPEKIYILPNALPETLSSTEFLSILEKRDLNKCLNLLFLSNMLDSKGWFTLLEACKLLNDADVDFVCHFVGDWPSRAQTNKFHKYVDDNLLKDKVIYHGKLLGTKKNQMLAIADILIFPTQYEAFGRVLIEAMEFGIPVISSNCGTIPSIIQHGSTGFILKNNSPAQIFDHVLMLQDKNFRLDMGIKARERFLEKFTLDTYRDRFVSILT